jgi:hypothetical protein
MASPNTVKCNICLDEDVKNPVFTPCIHGFCSECISRWLSEKKDNLRIPCPVCKFDIAALAGPRDPSQLYDDDAPIPQFPLRNAMMNIIQQITAPEPVPILEYVMRGLGIEELVRPDIPRNLLRQQGIRAIRPVHQPAVQQIPQQISPRINFASNMEALIRLIDDRRRELQQPPIQPIPPRGPPRRPPQNERRPMRRLVRSNAMLDLTALNNSAALARSVQRQSSPSSGSEATTSEEHSTNP